MDVGPSLTEIENTRIKLAEFVVETPVHEWRTEAISGVTAPGTDVFVKLELFQVTGTFKPRGAFTVLGHLSQDDLSRGVTTLSAGNHALALAYAARALGVGAKVVMPRAANPARVARCRAYGAEVVLVETIQDAAATMQRIADAEGRAVVHPFEGPFTALGTATLGWELCRQVPELDAVIIPIGGGGLCAGVARAVKLMQPSCAVFGVEPRGADTMHRSFAAGEPVSIERVETIADSLGAPYAMPYSFALCRRHVDELVMIEDEDMRRSMAVFFDDLKLAVEPACAAALAALAGPLRTRLAGRRVAVLACGTNIDLASYAALLCGGGSTPPQA